jgi:hypothetical protein
LTLWDVFVSHFIAVAALMERRVYWLLSGFNLRVEMKNSIKNIEILPLVIISVLPFSLFALLAKNSAAAISVGFGHIKSKLYVPPPQ